MPRGPRFQTVRSEGAILPPDLLQRIAGGGGIDGLTSESYHLPPGTKLKEAISQSWTKLNAFWRDFRTVRLTMSDADETGTKITRERWLLPLLTELGYGRIPATKGPDIEGKLFPIDRFARHVPIHLVGCKLSLDRRAEGVRGAATASPHGLVQEYLNRSEPSVWGFVSNGLVFRVLRDNKALSRQSYVEFDLEAMFEGNVYSDFSLLWLLCHQSRIDTEAASDCWLEQWSKLSHEQGTRVLEALRNGVQSAIEALGRGFVAHPTNDALRARLRRGELSTQDLYRQILRVVYRLLFLFVAEDRGLLHPPTANSTSCECYDRFYSARRLRDLAERMRGSAHGDLWRSLSVVFESLHHDAGRPQLGLPPLGSFLWSREATPDLRGVASIDDQTPAHPIELANDDLLSAVRALAFIEDNRVLRAVDYRNLGSEELGSVYESLLELHPRIEVASSADQVTFSLAASAGNDRKTSGSYYTPDSLVQCVLDSALEPVIADAMGRARNGADGSSLTGDARRAALESAILDLKVCDPACGSGHFLIAAAHRLAAHLARVRSGDAEPAPEVYRHAVRDIIRRCIYGIDINPMAVELCKVSLWLESLEAGKPLSFLDSHIVCGNSLLGVTPKLLKDGIPDDAFEPIEGDDKEACRDLKKQNKLHRKEFKAGQSFLFHPFVKLGDLVSTFATLSAGDDDSLNDVRERERRYADLVRSAAYANATLVADAWCAAFVWRKDRSDLGRQAVTERSFRELERSPHAYPDGHPVRQEIRRLAREYAFLHPHLAFPEVFRVPSDATEPTDPARGWSGGFDCILGNPPWERVKLQEKEWFAERSPEIANAPNAAVRKRLIEGLMAVDPSLHRDFLTGLRTSEGESHLLRSSGRYPLCGRGDINTFAVFAESMRHAIAGTGRLGIIVPTGIATDDTTKFFFGDMVESCTLVSYFGFKNERFLFPRPVEHTVTFGLLTALGRAHSSSKMEFCWLAWTVEEMQDPSRRITLTADDIAQLNPNTRTCPVFRSERDAEITKSIYRRVPVLIREARDQRPEENPWGIKFATMFHMSNDSKLFIAPDVACPAVKFAIESNADCAPYFPLYEAKLLHQFDHRWATYACDDCHWLTTSLRTKLNRDGNPEPDPRDMTAAEHERRDTLVAPRYWVASNEVDSRLTKTERNGNVVWRWAREWLLGFREIARNTDDRTLIATFLPRTAVNNKIPLVYLDDFNACEAACLLACLDSFVVDFAARQKVGGTTLSFFLVKQFPVLPPSAFAVQCPWLSPIAPEGAAPETPRGSLTDWIAQRVLELVYTADDLAGLARDLGYDGPPFRWDSAGSRRQRIRAELDAAFFHLYGVSRDDAAYVLDTFLVFKARDEARNGGVFSTKETILAIYDAMANSMRTGKSWTSALDPPPGDPRAAHDPEARPPTPRGGGPSTASFARPVSPRSEITPPTSNPVRDSTSAIIEAFLRVREGRSSDFVVCDPILNALYLERAREFGVEGDDAELNRRLLGARKTNRLTEHPTTRRYRLPRALLPYTFVAEWAARHVQRTLLAESNHEPSLDDILCDPALARRFDAAAARIRADIPSLDWRWAALAFRKRGRREARADTVALEPRDHAGIPLDASKLPSGPGLYLLADSERVYYANSTDNLRRQLNLHASLASDDADSPATLVPSWLLPSGAHANEARWLWLATGDPVTLSETRIRLVASHRPWLNLLENLAG
jgi:hypothetical protein